MKTSVVKIGDETAVIVPEEATAKLGLKVGQQLRARLLADGGLLIGPYDPAYDKATRIAEEVVDQYAETFEALPKS